MSGPGAAPRARGRVLAGILLVANATGAVYAFAALEDFLDRERVQRASDQAYARMRLDALAVEVAAIANAVALGRGVPPTDVALVGAPGSPAAAPALPAPDADVLRAALAEARAARDQAAASLDATAGKLAVLERSLEMLASARAVAERDRDELARQLALRVTADAARAGSAHGSTPLPPPRDALEGAPLLALVARIDEHLAHDPRTPRLRFVAARALVGETFEDVVLEERAADGAVARRLTAARASFELYQGLRLVRVRLATCHLAEDPASGGRELRLPELAVERYDVDVKSWRELARETKPIWLALR